MQNVAAELQLGGGCRPRHSRVDSQLPTQSESHISHQAHLLSSSTENLAYYTLTQEISDLSTFGQASLDRKLSDKPNSRFIIVPFVPLSSPLQVAGCIPPVLIHWDRGHSSRPKTPASQHASNPSSPRLMPEPNLALIPVTLSTTRTDYCTAAPVNFLEFFQVANPLTSSHLEVTTTTLACVFHSSRAAAQPNLVPT